MNHWYASCCFPARKAASKRGSSEPASSWLAILHKGRCGPCRYAGNLCMKNLNDMYVVLLHAFVKGSRIQAPRESFCTWIIRVNDEKVLRFDVAWSSFTTLGKRATWMEWRPCNCKAEELKRSLFISYWKLLLTSSKCYWTNLFSGTSMTPKHLIRGSIEGEHRGLLD